MRGDRLAADRYPPAARAVRPNSCPLHLRGAKWFAQHVAGAALVEAGAVAGGLVAEGRPEGEALGVVLQDREAHGGAARRAEAVLDE
ncbi:hypothetical protein AAW14_09840 [Streptomyces hygroscopicus]|nr:hypothetical protein [Streptomyces hygroscopicus]